uniref:Uncharacterized protein n=1 Tax=Meloidogyne enterolobii TaxID=390850 RepID=A0A6V7UVA7_MELEN|nr:unnamed protein product [Meloidogyne enterolobii]
MVINNSINHSQTTENKKDEKKNPSCLFFYRKPLAVNLACLCFLLIYSVIGGCIFLYLKNLIGKWQKRSCCSDQKYNYIDNFIGAFIYCADHHRDPEIVRGYWARTAAITSLVSQFIKISGPSAQIIIWELVLILYIGG